MMINAINFNTRINTYYSKSNNISFKGQNAEERLKEIASTFAFEEFFNGKSRICNNILLKSAIKKGNYKHAYEDIISRAGDNFDHNLYDKNSGLTLLILLYDNMHFIKNITQSKYRDLLKAKIFYHPAFNPNDYVFLNVNNPEKGLKKVTYLEYAVRDNNVELLTYLCDHPFIKDPYNDDFETISGLSAHPHIQLLLNRMKLRSIFDNQGETEPENTAVAKEKEIYESDAVKSFRKEIKADLPSSLDEIGGLHKAKSDILDYIIKPWSNDIRQKLKDNNIDMPNGFMMYGPPGCGKTYIVQVIAKQTGFPMYEVPLSDIGDSAAYSIPKKLRKIFNALEEQYQKNNIPSILFLDEIDSICASRESAQMDWKRDDVNALITLLNNASDKGIIVIGATNLLDNVDKAVLRTGRFDKKIEVALPNLEERKDILEKLIGRRKIELSLLDNIDKLAKATEGKSCSDLAAIVNDCGRRAIYKGKKSVKVKDFEQSIDIINENRKEKHLIGFHN